MVPTMAPCSTRSTAFLDPSTDRIFSHARAVGVACGLEDTVQHHVGSAEQAGHVLVGLEHVFGHLHGHRIGPIAGLLAYHNKTAARDARLEAVNPLVAGQTAIGAAHDQNVALAAQLLDHTLAGQLARIEVVGAHVGDVQALVALSTEESTTITGILAA